MGNKTAIKSQDLRNMANSLDDFAKRYRDLADEMDANRLTTLEVTGLSTFQDKVLGNLGRNTRRITTQLQTALDNAAIAPVAAAEQLITERRKKKQMKGE